MVKEIDSEARTIGELLSKKYKIDYYQREYRWKESHIQELINDLTNKFLECYSEGNERPAVESYAPYFMGSIIICNKKQDGAPISFIVDGQQRLTSLTLLFIFLYKNIKSDEEHLNQLKNLIHSYSFKSGKESFNIDIKERDDCMNDIFKGREDNFEKYGYPLKNLIDRYRDIENYFPQQIENKKGWRFFANWLSEKVFMSKITAISDDDAYAIFETMNDRGLSLTPTEMLKSYLLSKIDEPKREEAEDAWKKQIKEFSDLEEKDVAAKAITAWLRGQHAKTIRGTSKGDKNEDFEHIATQFHRWVGNNEENLSLKKPQNFTNFIKEDFAFYSEEYRKIHKWAHKYDQNFLAIRSNAYLKFTLQFPVILSSFNLRPRDSEQEIARKIKIVATYINIVLARRIWNHKSITERGSRYFMFRSVIQKIRRKSAEEIANQLIKTFKENNGFVPPFGNKYPVLKGNRGRIHWFLASITNYIETESKKHKGDFGEYINEDRPPDNPYEIEHILGNEAPENYEERFPNFEDSRNQIGALLLLPKKVNVSIKDSKYNTNEGGKKRPIPKRDAYVQQNQLAASLHPNAHKNNPGFTNFIKRSGLDFKAYDEFTPEVLEERCELYRQIAMRLWDPEQLLKIAEEG